MTAQEYFGEWWRVIDKKELSKVMNILAQTYKKVPVCPEFKNVFRAFELCPYRDLKVIFLGQDPYPQKGVATGLAFANSKETLDENLSPSLNILKESAINYEVPHFCCNFDPSLESWASQGVLLLNSALTVEQNKVGSHTMIWRKFISQLLIKLSEYNTGLIYVLFGKQAQTFSPYIGRFNTVIKVEHPAYLARTHQKLPHSFFVELSRLVKYNFGDQMVWFTEEEYS